MDQLEIVRRRLLRQHLAGERLSTVEECVRWFGAMQAQEFVEACWSVAERVRDCTQGDVEEALADGLILRTHVLRPTWHFVARDDLRWLLRLTAPRVRAAAWARHAALGLDDAMLAAAKDALRAALEGGAPMTRDELVPVLRQAGVEPGGQRMPHILIDAELDALVCSGPRRGRHHTYLLLDDRAPVVRDRSHDEALGELALRYFSSHGPATARDFAWWSSLRMADVRRGLALAADRLEREEDDDGLVWWSARDDRVRAPVARALLIGTYDELTVAYRGHRTVLGRGAPAGDPPRRPIVVDGVTVGGWARTAKARSVTIEAVMFRRPSAAQRRALSAAAERFGAFAGLPATLTVEVASPD